MENYVVKPFILAPEWQTYSLVPLPSCKCHLRRAMQQFLVLHYCLGCRKKTVYDKLKVTNTWQSNRGKSTPHKIVSPRGN